MNIRYPIYEGVYRILTLLHEPHRRSQSLNLLSLQLCSSSDAAPIRQAASLYNCLFFMSCLFNDVVLVLLNLSKSHLASLWIRTDRDADFSVQLVFIGWLPAFLADSGVVLFV